MNLNEKLSQEEFERYTILKDMIEQPEYMCNLSDPDFNEYFLLSYRLEHGKENDE